MTLKSNISFFVEALDEFPIEVKFLITEIALETSILSWYLAQFLIRHIIQIEKLITVNLRNLTKWLASLLIKIKKIIFIIEMRSKKISRTQLQICKALKH